MVFLGGLEIAPLTNPIAMVLRRTEAFLLDILIIFGICAPIGYLIQRLIGTSPQTGPAIWSTILWNISLPAWLYFLWSDHSKKGKSVGKWLLNLKVKTRTSERLGWGRALARTAIKLLPWEIIHFSSFALSKEFGTFTLHQYIGLVAGNLLAFAYFIASILTQGKRSIHDILLGTEIQFENF
ncbi:MAG: RDD family protein [Candidatus Aminicenantes bacterium]|nr:MAG: RDD family protein [Candidatus Aminicenantes bacterium]